MPKKDKIIQEIRQLPDDVLNEMYSLDVITHKGKMYCNLWLADRLKTDRDLGSSENFFRFRLGTWNLEMEVEDQC